MRSVTKLSVVENVLLINLPKAPSSVDFLGRVLNVVAENGICVDMIALSPSFYEQSNLSFTILDNDMAKLLNVLSEVLPDGIVPLLTAGNAKITLFGEEMQYTPGVAARAMKTLSLKDIEINLITTSDFDISILVDYNSLDDAITVLNREFSL